MDYAEIILIEPCEYRFQYDLIECLDNFEIIDLEPCFTQFTFQTDCQLEVMISELDICNNFDIVPLCYDFDAEVGLLCGIYDNYIYFITKDGEYFKTSLEEYLTVKK